MYDTRTWWNERKSVGDSERENSFAMDVVGRRGIGVLVGMVIFQRLFLR